MLKFVAVGLQIRLNGLQIRLNGHTVRLDSAVWLPFGWICNPRSAPFGWICNPAAANISICNAKITIVT